MNFRKALAAMLALALMATPSGVFAQGAGPAKYFWFQAVTEEGEPFQEEGAVRCSVYARDASTGSSIVHANATLTTPYTLPLASSVNGIIHWYSSSTDPVNLKCYTQYGDYAFKNNFSINRHKVQIDTSGAYKVFRFPYVTSASPTATGLVIPMGGIVTGASVERITIADGAHINVGFAGNHAVASRNAIVSQLAVDQRGFVTAHLTANAGADASAFSATASSHIGMALRHQVASTGSGFKSQIVRPYQVHVSSGLEITYDTANIAGIGGHVYIYWTQQHVGANRQPYR